MIRLAIMISNFIFACNAGAGIYRPATDWGDNSASGGEADNGPEQTMVLYDLGTSQWSQFGLDPLHDEDKT